MARCKNWLTLYKIRNAATYKVKYDVRNAISNAVANSARSDLGKKGKDPDQHLDEAEQVTFEKDRASINKGNAKKTDLWKRYADPKQILDKADQARMKKLKVLDDKSHAKASICRNGMLTQNRFWTKPIKPSYE